MRLVHEIWHKAQISVSGKPYTFRVDIDPGPYRGAQLDLHVTVPGIEAESIYIEGDLGHIMHMIEELLEALKAVDEACRQDYDADVAANWQSGHERYLSDHSEA